MKCMTRMENAIINLTGCNRTTANLAANAILDIDRITNEEPERTLSEEELTNLPKVIAIDFDGCLVTNKWPKIGEPIEETIARYRVERAAGSKFMFWSCRNGVLLEEALAWCEEHDIILDAVNDVIPEMKGVFGPVSRKIFANEYWDDRGICMPAKK